MTNEEKQALNAFIAEKLFGWRWITYFYQPNKQGIADIIAFLNTEKEMSYMMHRAYPDNSLIKVELGVAEGAVKDNSYPNYISDPSALQMVKDELRKRKTFLRLTDGLTFWNAALWTDPTSDVYWSAEADMEGEALCLAVKQMLEAERELR